MLLEKCLNKEVIVEEKLYQYASTISQYKIAQMSIGIQNRIEGTLTAIDDEFIELDHNQLIARKHIYRITLK